MNRLSITLLFFWCFVSAFTQITWYDPLSENAVVIQNQGWPDEIGKSFQRLPNRAEGKVRKAVWDLSGNSAGLAIHFNTNAEQITVRYGVTGSKAMNHMPATGKSGVDLYAIDSDGKWRFASGKFSFGDTITYRYDHLMQSEYHKCGFEYRLYLPLYNSVEWLEIGIPDSASISFIPQLKEKPLVVYGTSIAQGGCASRPGMGWTNIVSRKLDLPVINLAFSGNGPLEKELVDLIYELDAAMVIFDCLPNMGSLTSDEVKQRTTYAVSRIREKSNVPILIVDHIGYSNDQTNSTRKEIPVRLNAASKETYDSLKRVGVSNLYHLSKEEIQFPVDGSVDYVHPNDLGMQAYAAAYEKAIRQILNMPTGASVVTKPVSQRREPGKYEWNKRHQEKLVSVRSNPPRKVIIGNSITHYWNEAKGLGNGPESWKKYMSPNGFLNLGYGWDRIENVLWRVYHGELDGYEAEEVAVLIGSNNLDINSDDEIVDGLEFLLRQIKLRQPNALIKVIGILPRINKEEHVLALNKSIRDMANRNNFQYIDVGEYLLEKGKIVESLFTDGLHPNEKGYELIAPHIAR